MSGNEFDELIGAEPAGRERERLRRTHDLLVAAGPPPELSPELEAGPTLAMTLGRPPRQLRRRVGLLVAAAIAVVVVFLGGYIAGNKGGGNSTPGAVHTLRLSGTSLAPAALASLRLEPEDAAGNWPMLLDVSGLPALPQDGYYAVYVVRDGKPWKPCGWFTVDNPHEGVTVTLNSPYQLQKGDSWIVTRQAAGSKGAGETVLQPANA